MKLLCVDVDRNNSDLFDNFCATAESLIGLEIIKVSVPFIERHNIAPFPYVELSCAGVALEDYVMQGDRAYWSPDKPYVSALFAYGDYSTEKLAGLAKYQDTNFSDLIMFQHGSIDKEHSWTFGNITSMIKWSSSLFKIQSTWFTGRDQLTGLSSMNMAIWYATRIGLDTRCL